MKFYLSFRFYNMRRLYSCIVFLLIADISFSQNLVLNPSFESEHCSKHDFNEFQIDLMYWSQLHTGDYYSSQCDPQGFIYNYPKSGNCYTGIFVNAESFWLGKRYVGREYLIGRLKEPMKVGKKYNVSFWVKPSYTIDDVIRVYTTSNVSLAFVKDSAEIKKAQSKDEIFLYQLPEHITNTKGNIMDYVNYTKVDGCYTATGGEKYIVIGNFRHDSLSTFVPLTSQSYYKRAYFLVDDVNVSEVEELDKLQDTTMCREEILIKNLDTSLFSEIHLNGSPLDPSGSFKIKEEGRYLVTARQESCMVEKEIEIKYIECNKCNIYIPNIFIPNGDNINDVMTISSNCEYEFKQCRIFNRWGAVVFSSTSDCEWDGRTDGRLNEVGVYIYFLELKINRGHNIETIQKSGEITLLN